MNEIVGQFRALPCRGPKIGGTVELHLKNGSAMTMRSVWYVLAITSVLAGCKGSSSHDTSTALKARGDSLKTAGDLDAAIRAYDEAIALDSTDGKVYNNRGTAYKSKGDYDRAMKDFDRAIVINPDHGQALKNRG